VGKGVQEAPKNVVIFWTELSRYGVTPGAYKSEREYGVSFGQKERVGLENDVVEVK